ncbi:disulfide bond formation protein B [Microvirga massiliensis]|uniref:disulfide bond formation protein B n=1 Tax=Microvirga massiliensis TaxID=1033741 RepID=UPI00062B72E3|nr:disulfide bond formation protein B [Microvirga massiliensis]
MRFPLTLQQTGLAIAVAAAGAIGGAFVFQYGLGLAPCKLCLLQRNPYYLAIPLGLAAALAPPRWSRIALGLLVIVFLVSAGLGIYHAGVEWGFWLGPSDCGGGAASTGSMNDFLQQLERTRVVSCTEAAWRFLGLSLAGWNVVISLGAVLFAGASLAGNRKRSAA